MSIGSTKLQLNYAFLHIYFLVHSSLFS